MFSLQLTNSAGAVQNVGAWCAKTNDVNQYLQVRFNSVKKISGVATQGREEYNQYVRSYQLEFSLDGYTWHYYNGGQVYVLIENVVLCGVGYCVLCIVQ